MKQKPKWQVEIEKFDKETSKSNKKYYSRNIHCGTTNGLERFLSRYKGGDYLPNIYG